MFGITFKSGLIAGFFFIAGLPAAEARSTAGAQVEIVTKARKQKSRVWLRKKNRRNHTTTLYLKNGCALPSTQLIPVLEFHLEGGTYVSTPRGYFPAARLAKGDRVFCRESDGKVSALEVGMVYRRPGYTPRHQRPRRAPDTGRII